MIIQKYSDLFVECDDVEVRDLYWLLSLYFAKCDGLLTVAEVQRLEDGSGSSATHAVFSPYIEPTSRKQRIIARLKFLKQYGITKPKEIMGVMTQALFNPSKPASADLKYLKEFTENPGESPNWFAGRLGVNVSSVTRAVKRLREAIDFRFFYSTDYTSFKLRQFLLYFRPNSSFNRSMLSSREFTRNVNCDTFGEWMWASFLVPGQERILSEFKGSLADLGGEVFRDHRLYEIKSCARHNSFSMFDGEKWFFSEEALGIGAFKYAEANKEILPRLKEYIYSYKSIRFDQVDLLLSLILLSDSLTKNSDVRTMLKENGYGDISRVAVSRRKATLARSGVFFPASGFSGLGLDTSIVFAIECDLAVRETLYHMFPLLPDVYAYRTDKGVVGMLRTPAEMSSRISYLLQSLKDEVHYMIITSRFENIGSRTWRHMVRYWNSEKQYWDFKRGFFDLTKGLSEPS